MIYNYLVNFICTFNFLLLFLINSNIFLTYNNNYHLFFSKVLISTIVLTMKSTLGEKISNFFESNNITLNNIETNINNFTNNANNFFNNFIESIDLLFRNDNEIINNFSSCITKQIIDKGLQEVLEEDLNKKRYDCVIAHINHKKKIINLNNELRCRFIFKLIDINNTLIIDFDNLIEILPYSSNIAKSFFKYFLDTCLKKNINLILISYKNDDIIFNTMKKILEDPYKYFNNVNVITSYNFKKDYWKKNKFTFNIDKCESNVPCLNIPNKEYIIEFIIKYYNINIDDIIYIGTDSSCLDNNKNQSHIITKNILKQ